MLQHATATLSPLVQTVPRSTLVPLTAFVLAVVASATLRLQKATGLAATAKNALLVGLASTATLSAQVVLATNAATTENATKVLLVTEHANASKTLSAITTASTAERANKVSSARTATSLAQERIKALHRAGAVATASVLAKVLVLASALKVTAQHPVAKNATALPGVPTANSNATVTIPCAVWLAAATAFANLARLAMEPVCATVSTAHSTAPRNAHRTIQQLPAVDTEHASTTQLATQHALATSTLKCPLVQTAS